MSDFEVHPVGTVERLRAEIAALREAVDPLRKRCRTYRRALRQLNKAHDLLWKVLSIRLTARRGNKDE